VAEWQKTWCKRPRLNAEWRLRCTEIATLSLLSAQKRNSPTYIKQVRLIGARVSTTMVGNRTESAEWRISPLCEKPAAIFSTQPGPCTARLINESAMEQTPLTSHAKGLLSSKGIGMRPSGFLPSWCTKPTVSLATGTPTKARATRSFNVWCLDQKGLDNIAPNGLFADKVVQTASVDRRAAAPKVRTATLTASVSRHSELLFIIIIVSLSHIPTCRW